MKKLNNKNSSKPASRKHWQNDHKIQSTCVKKIMFICLYVHVNVFVANKMLKMEIKI